MIREVCTNKWILGGISFLALFAGLCYLWYQHTTAPYREQVAETEELLRQRETEKVQPNSTVETTSTKAPAESTTPTVEKPITQTFDVDKADTHHKETQVNQELIEISEEIPVSRFGFGPFPKTPDGMTPIPWERLPSADHELMRRVRIKLWEEGIPTDGAVMENGLVYPTVRGRVYIQESGILSHPDDNIRIIRGRLPDLSGFDIYNVEDGIEPYSYLNIER